jgi:hypothetical protein
MPCLKIKIKIAWNLRQQFWTESSTVYRLMFRNQNKSSRLHDYFPEFLSMNFKKCIVHNTVANILG